MQQPRPDQDQAHAARRLDSARRLIRSHQFRESMVVARQPSLRNSGLAGFQAALTALIALPLIQLSHWSELIGYASLGTLAALFGRFAPRAKRGPIVFYCALLQTLTVFTMSTIAWAGASPELQILLLALACGFFFVISTVGEFGPPGALIFIFAGSVAMGPADTFGTVLERTLATGATALLAWLICLLTETFRHGAAGGSLPQEPPRPLSHRLIAVARIIVGSAVAAFTAYYLGAENPGWAAMGALAVMQGAHLHISFNRAIQRMAGTAIGAALVYLALIYEPSVWAVIPLLLLLTIGTEMIIGSNYGLGQILVTPMALLMSYLASPDAAGAGMVEERVLDTMIGIVIGVVLSVLASTLDDRVYLAHHDANRMK